MPYQRLLVDGTVIDPPTTSLNFAGATLSKSGDVSTLTFQTGDITAVVAGAGMTGGGTSGSVTLNVIAGTGITVNADDVAINQAFAPTWTGNHIHAPTAATSGAVTALTVTGAADTGQTASTERPLVYLNGARTVTWATGAITTQREIRIAAPTYAFVGASTITDAATLAVSGSPAAGTNATITRSHALWVQAGSVNLGRSTVSQATDINTNVTCNGASGVITTQSASTAAATIEAGFTLNNTAIHANSVVTCTIVGYSGAYVTNGYPILVVAAPGAGTVGIKVGNTHAANALSGTLLIHFTVT